MIRVINYSELIQRIAVEAINETNVGDLASRIDAGIKEGRNNNDQVEKVITDYF